MGLYSYRLFRAIPQHRRGGQAGRQAGRHGGVLTPCMAVGSWRIDSRTPTMPGRSTSGFHRPGRRPLNQSAKRRQVFGESHGGRAACILSRTACQADFLAYRYIDGSAELIVFFSGVATCRATAAGGWGDINPRHNQRCYIQPCLVQLRVFAEKFGWVGL